MIVQYLGDGVKGYQRDYLRLLPKVLICPICDSNCHWHCWYKRQVREAGQISHIQVLRVLCKKCGKTHAVIPDFLRPKSRYSQQVRERAITNCVLHGVTAEASTLDGQAVETTRRWVRQFKMFVGETIMTLTSLLAQWGEYELPRAGRVLAQLKELLKKIIAHLGGWPKHSCRLGLINLLINLGPPPRAYL